MQEVAGQIVVEQEAKVFATANCIVSQLDDARSFNLALFGIDLDLKFCGLYALHKKIKAVDVMALFEADSSGMELFYLPQCDRILAFDLIQIIELKEFLEGTFAMLQLNSLIHESTCRRLV